MHAEIEMNWSIGLAKFQALVGIASSWILAGLTGFVPVFTGIYSDPSVLEQHQMDAKADTVIACDLAPNKVMAINVSYQTTIFLIR